MRFGSVDTFFDFGDWGFRMGRPVANQGFLGALLRHGTWDAYHFFCPDTAQVAMFSSRVAQLVPEPELLKRVFVSPQAHLPSHLRAHDFDAFHQGDFTYFTPWLAALRNRAGQRPFPITGVTHSLDGALMQLRFLQLVLAGLAPWDAIVCTSHAAATLVRAKLDEVSAELPPPPARASPAPRAPRASRSASTTRSTPPAAAPRRAPSCASPTTSWSASPWGAYRSAPRPTGRPSSRSSAACTRRASSSTSSC